MAIYDYKCELHGVFEVEHSIHDKLKTCPKCKEEGIKPPKRVERLISGGTNFVLLGDSWAKDSYK